MHVSLILEMIGRPAEHIKDTLGKLIDGMGNEKGIEIMDRKVAEPKKIDKIKEEMYSIFGDVEIKADSLQILLLIVFKYMPSHIEVISPAELKFKNNDLNNLLNLLIIKLHRYDEVVKRLVMEKNILQNQLARTKQEIESKNKLIPAIKKESKKTSKTKKPNARKKKTKSIKKSKKI